MFYGHDALFLGRFCDGSGIIQGVILVITFTRHQGGAGMP